MAVQGGIRMYCSLFSILSLAFPLCLSQPVPQKVLPLLLVHTPCSNCFTTPPWKMPSHMVSFVSQILV